MHGSVAVAETGGGTPGEIAMNASLQGFVPRDGFAGTLVGRVWRPGAPGGPAVAAFRAEGVFDLSRAVPTMAHVSIGFRCALDGPPDAPAPAPAASP